MDAKIKALSAFFVVAVILGSMPLLVFANGNDNEWPLGKDIAASFDEILSAHRTDIDTFIIGHKDLMAETQEERLDIIEEELGGLRDKIDSVNTARQELIAQLQNDEITDEEFGQEMRALTTDLNGVGEIGRELGQRLGDLGKTLADELKARAEALSEDLDAVGAEMAEAGRAIAEEMSGRDLPVPEGLPGGKPEEVSGEGEEPPIPEEPGEEGEIPEEVPPGEPPRGPPEGVP